MKIALFFLSLCVPLAVFSLPPKKLASGDQVASPYFPKVPRKLVTNAFNPLIVIDPGHGGNDEGAKVATVLEKKIALTTALLAKKHLESQGYRVILTRSRDIYVPLARRALIANKNQGALFVSIHFNAAKSPVAHGIEVFYYPGQNHQRANASKELANHVLYHLLDQTDASSRGVKKGNHHVTRETAMPAIMVEGGFITNPEERGLLKDRKYLECIAKGIADGVDKYLKSQ
jgi:N-acetylmuramoyl-L-alanine amidase